MSRDQWEFNTGEYHTTVLPSLRFSGGTTLAPSVGNIYIGEDSGFSLTVTDTYVEVGDFADDDATGTIQFTTNSTTLRPLVGRSVF